MANLNKVMLMGNLTRDPQLTYLPSNQTAVCEVGLAVNRRWTGQDGQQREETTFVDCTAYGKTAETIAKYLKKGRPLFIEGRLKLDQWEKDGQKRSKLRVVIDNFQFIDSRPAGESSGGGEGGYAPRAEGRAPYRPAGRPAPAQAAPQYEGDAPAAPEDDVPPPMKEDDIPF